MALLTDRLRKASRDVHDVSDALVNARLLALFTSRTLYARAIGCFYLVFSEIEELLGKHGADADLAPFHDVLSKLRRREAFGKDLEFYLGQDWQARIAAEETEAVQAYKLHLRSLVKTQPVLLLAHAYTQYLALAAGGQIIRRAARKHMQLPEDQGTALFEFEGSSTELRTTFKSLLNSAAASMEPQTVDKLVEEHCLAFRFNNAIIRSFNLSLAASIKGALMVAPMWLRMVLLTILVLLVLAVYSLAARLLR